MFVIDLRRADGAVLPYRMGIEPDESGYARLRIFAARDERAIAEGKVDYARVPLSTLQGDVRCGNITLGWESSRNLLLVEFGDEPRFATLPAAEVRSALNVCRWYDRDTSARLR